MQLVPKERYTSPAFMERETRGLWPRVWLLAGRSAALTEVGSWITVEFGAQSVIVARAKDGLVAHHNVCSHRGHRLTDQPSGRGRGWSCPYHRWSYSLEGELLAVPDEHAFGPSFDRCNHGLSAVRVDEALGFVWVHMGTPEVELGEWLAPVSSRLNAYGIEQWGQSSALSIDLGANWKTVVDAWNETYHAQGIHRQILGLIDDVNVRFEELGPHGLLVVPFAAPSPRLGEQTTLNPLLQHMLRSAGVDPARFEGGAAEVRPAIQGKVATDRRYDALQPEQLTDCYNHYVFPNHSFVMWRDHMVLHRYRPHPTDPGRSWVDLFSLQRGAPESATHEVWAEDDPRMEEVLAQDIAAVRSTQAGMRSVGFEGLVLGDTEERIRHMHRQLDATLDAAESGGSS